MSDDQEIAATRLVQYVDQCLRHATQYKLSMRGRRAIAKWVGEIITNAEEHSGTGEWFAIGYMIPIEASSAIAQEANVFECQMAIFNLGRSMAESLQNPHLSGETQKLIQALSAAHLKRKLFSRAERFSPDDLWTLYALQDGVSRFSAAPGENNRGKGTVEMIEAFQTLGKSKSENCIPEMVLISGGTRILFNGNYKMAEQQVAGGVRMVIAFNAENSLEEKPDPKNVHSLDGFFPGTILGFRFFLDRRNIEEINHHDNPSTEPHRN